MDNTSLFVLLLFGCLVNVSFCQILHYQGVSESDSDSVKSSERRPNIVFIVADDLGWNDVGWHNSAMPTPHLNQLHDNNHTIELNQYYVQYVCTPSRTAFMTGYYPFKVGLQHYVISGRQPNYVPAQFRFLPEYLKPLGYRTHAIGKWHLGFCRWDKTPTYRGFDSFYGFYNGQADYYKHTYAIDATPGYDFRDNKKVVRDQNGTYSTFSFTTRAVDIIENSKNSNKPFYIYLAYQNIHTPLQVPKNYLDPKIVNPHRRYGTAMMKVLDEGVGNITRALEDSGKMDNTIIVFTTDNGANVAEAGNNWPLRGSKLTAWEGGTRGVGIVHYEKFRNYQYNGLFHIVDWLPTLVDAAGGLVPNKVDGVSQWNNLLSTSQLSSRSEFVYNIDEIDNVAAIRVGDYKLIVGGPGKINRNGWYPPLNDLTSIHGIEALKITDLFGDVVLKTTTKKNGIMLYNLRLDPYERIDLSQKEPDIVNELYKRLQYYNQTRVPARFPDEVEAGDPSHWGGVWTPGWC